MKKKEGNSKRLRWRRWKRPFSREEVRLSEMDARKSATTISRIFRRAVYVDPPSASTSIDRSLEAKSRDCASATESVVAKEGGCVVGGAFLDSWRQHEWCSAAPGRGFRMWLRRCRKAAGLRCKLATRQFISLSSKRPGRSLDWRTWACCWGDGDIL